MASQVQDGAWYYIMNQKTLTSLNVLGNGGAGTAVVGATSQWSAQPANSIWQAQSQGNGRWKFQSAGNGTYLWASGDAALDPVQVWDRSAGENQLWTVQPNNIHKCPTFFTITSVANAMNVDLAGGNPANAAPVLLQHPTGISNQNWVFVPTNA